MTDEPGSPVTGPPLRLGKRVALRTTDRSDFDFLYALASSPTTGFRWRYRGATPSPELFAAQLWDGVLAQFTAVDRRSGDRVGVVSVYNASFQNGHAYLALAAAPPFRSTGYMLEAAFLFLDYAFKVWDLRKLYMETAAFNLAQFSSGIGRLFQEEGRLSEHEFYDGSYWDLVFLSIDRSAFQSYAPRYLDVLAEKDPQ